MGLDVKGMLVGDTRRMSHVWRYSSVPVHRMENVAEHSWYVTYYSLLIARDLENAGHEIDRAKLLTAATVHDLDECLTGDILRSVKYGHPLLKQALDESAKKMMGIMCDSLGVDVTQEWGSAKDGSVEGSIIVVADLLTVLSYVTEQIRGGNHHLLFIVREVRSNFEMLLSPHSRIHIPHEKLYPYIRDALSLSMELIDNVNPIVGLERVHEYTP